MTPAQQKLKAAHGTPKEFAEAIWAAFAQIFVTYDEAVKAIRDYENEWHKAGL